MMDIQDQWGQDLSVQSLRRVFSYMETAQRELLNGANISFLDGRLREGREQTKKLFERVWSLAVRKKIFLSEEEIAHLYLQCFARTLSLNGIPIPSNALPDHEKMVRLLQEDLQ